MEIPECPIKNLFLQILQSNVLFPPRETNFGVHARDGKDKRCYAEF